MNSATIKLHLHFGETGRLRRAEVTNWSGLAFAAPKAELDLLLKCDELTRPGVYVLLGMEFGKSGYIGEAENVRERLKQHSTKDFWSRAFVFTDKDENLTKAHIRYLEGRLIDESKDAGSYSIQNSQASGAKLPESEKQAAEIYLAWVRQLMPVLGCDLLAARVTKGDEKPSDVSVPTSATEFAQALKKLAPEITPKQREMLQVHYHAPARRLTAGQMAEKVGYTSVIRVNGEYGRLAKMLRKALGLAKEDGEVKLGVLVEFIRPNDQWIWIMRPELAEALQSLGWV